MEGFPLAMTQNRCLVRHLSTKLYLCSFMDMGLSCISHALDISSGTSLLEPPIQEHEAHLRNLQEAAAMQQIGSVLLEVQEAAVGRLSQVQATRNAPALGR